MANDPPTDLLPPAASTKIAAPQLTGAVADISQLLHFAMEKGVAPEALEKLVAVYERLQDRAAAAEFANAKNAFQIACPSITKNREAEITPRDASKKGFKYKYAELDHIVRTIRATLHANGLAYSWGSIVDGASKQQHCTCVLRHINGHSEQVQHPIIPETGTGGISAMQKFQIAKTFARRQTLIDVLGLSTCDEDTDAVLGDPEPITPGELSNVEALVRESGVSLERFCKHMGITKLADIPQNRYEMAITALYDQIAYNKKPEAAE